MQPAVPDLLRALGYPPWAAVLAVAIDGDEGIAVIDANGDGNEICTDGLVRWTGGWDAGGYPIGSAGSGRTQTLAYACGEAEPGSVVAVEFLGNKHRVTTEPSGWWAFAARVDGADGHSPVPRRA